MLPSPIQNAIDALSDLPGIGTRSAERLVFALLKNQTPLDLKLAEAFGNLKKNIRECEISCNYSEAQFCPLAIDPKRNDQTVCVVEYPGDIVSLERTQAFDGRYHVLHGLISPMNKVGPESLRIEALVKRVKQNSQVEEIIIALPASVEGEATAFYLGKALEGAFEGKISKLSRGIPSGGDLDYLDANTLGQAITDRRGV